MTEKKMRSIIRVLTVAIILLISGLNVRSQVPVERSTEKVIISGVAYYVHHVRKGETAYSISKAYGISVEELTKENPPALYGLNDGQILRIPVKPLGAPAVTAAEASKTKHDDSKFVYHTLKPGETVYFLSKTYDVSENEIVQSNPGIDITKLSVGMEIAVPRKEFMSNRQKFEEPQKPMPGAQEKTTAAAPVSFQNQTQNQTMTQIPPQEKGYIYHVVKSGETLSSIAEQYGLSLKVLRKANKEIRFPQVGDSLKVPGISNPVINVVHPVEVATVIPPDETPVMKRERPAGFTAVKDLKGTMNIAVLLPFYLKENSWRLEIDSSSVKGKKPVKVTRRGDDWIYPGSLDFIEMYEGILLAADTLRSLGLNVNIHTYDIKSDTIELTRLINAGKLEQMDLIIGPVYSHNLSIVADYANEFGIPVVSPVQLLNNSVLSGKSNLFLATSSLEVAQQALARKFSEAPENNFIFIHSDSLGIDEDVKRFRKIILSELSTKIPYEEIKFREFPFYSRSMFNNDSINRLSHALSDRTKNIVVIASEDPPVISESMIDIHSLSKRFDIKVYGYPAMRDIDNLDPKYFFDLDLMIYSPYWIDYSKQAVIGFNSDFRQKFLTEPTEKSYAWQGYDIAYFFMSGLAIHGKEFLRNPEIHHPDLLQTDYIFLNKEPGSGFENHNLYLIRYTKEYEVKLADDENLVLK
jgi:LysM repeat protein